MSDSVARFSATFLFTLGLVAALAAPASAQPFDQMHCYQMRDTVLHEAAVSLIEAEGEIPETCQLKSRAVRACVPARATERGQKPEAPEAEGSLLFDRLCYKIACESEDEGDTAKVVDRFGEHEFALGETSTLCMPAALGDMDEFISRGSPETAEEARKRAAGVAQDVDLRTCGDVNDDGNLTATDALAILKSSRSGTGSCLPCVCDVDNSDSITATDALASLQNAVGILADLSCEPDGTVVTWDGGGDGVSWGDPLNWSMDTRTPNLCEVATIASGAIVTVAVDTGSHQALSVVSSFPFDVDRGSLTLRDTIRVNNTFEFTGGTLIDAIIPASNIARGADTTANGTIGAGPIFTSSGGTLNNVIVNAPMDLSASSARISIDNGLTLNNTATLGSSAQLQFGGHAHALDGTGEVVFVSASQGFVNATTNTALTIGPDMTIRGTAGRVGNSTGTASLINNGTINSDAPGIITINGGGGWTNENQILASNGGSLTLDNTWTNNDIVAIGGDGILTLDGDWNNAGTITSNGATVRLDGTFTVSDLGTFNRSGGTVELRGIFDNILALQLNSTTGDWEMRGGTVMGGAITQADGAEMVFTSTGGTLDGVTFNAPMNLAASSARVGIDNGLTLNDTATLGSSAQLQFGGQAHALDGTGEVVFVSASQGFVNATTNTALTIGPDMTIRGTAGRVGNSSGTVSLTNNGTIHSDAPGIITVNGGAGWTNENQILASNGGSLTLANTWTNNSMISITGGGTLILDDDWNNAGTIGSTDSVVRLDGTFTLSDLGTFDRSGGTVELRGTLENAPGLTLDSTTGDWEMRGGTVMGGAVAQADGAEMVFTSTGGTLDSATFNAPMNLAASSARVSISNGLTLNDTATLGSSAQLQFGGQAHALDGTGEVVFVSASQGFVNTTTNTALTIGPDMTIRGTAGRVGNGTGTASLINNGTIHSDAPGIITVNGGAGWTNEGQIIASAGGSLTLDNTWTNNSTVSITGGGTLKLDGDWKNMDTISSTDSVVQLDGAFTLSDLGTFNRSGGTVELRGIFDNILALLLNSTTGDWEMRGGTVMGGAVTQADGAEMVFTSTGGTVDGVTFNAPMNLAASSARVSISNGLTLNDTATLGSSAQLQFGGQAHALDGTGEVVFVSASQGFVNTTTNTALTIGSDMTIRGTAGRVGNSTGTASLINNGTIHSDTPGLITITSGAGWTNNGILQASGGGTLHTINGWTNNGSIVLDENATLNATSGLPLTASGDLSVDVGSSSDFSVIDVTGSATLAGTLDINLTNGFMPTAGQSFTIMTYDSASGAFDTITGTDIGGGLTFDVVVGATDITLNVVN